MLEMKRMCREVGEEGEGGGAVVKGGGRIAVPQRGWMTTSKVFSISIPRYSWGWRGPTPLGRKPGKKNGPSKK